MHAMVAMPAWPAICSIVGLAVLLVIQTYPIRSKILFEGVLEEVDCWDLIGTKAAVTYWFATPFIYQIRADESLFCSEISCRIPLTAENHSGDYIPRAGHNIRVTGWYNFPNKMLCYKFERLPDREPIELILDPFFSPDF
ncbi:MAG: hypothetical protein Q8L24_00675 [bacterium]|nr:hypothetical protein [bacterium]